MSTKRFAALFMALAMVFTLMAPAFAFADGELPEEAPVDPCYNGHTPGSAVQENNVEPTCTEAGYCDSVVYCEICRAELSRDQVTTDPALGHDFGDWTQTTEPTCTEPGEETRYCSRCPETETQPIDALGHDFTVFVETVEPTAEAQGYTVYKCSRCDETEKRDFTDYVAPAADPEPEKNEPEKTESEEPKREGAKNRNVLTSGYYLLGTMNSWSVDNLSNSYLLTSNGGNEYKIKANVSVGDSFKVVWIENDAITPHASSNDGWFGSGNGNGNYYITADTAKGSVTIYFRDTWQDGQNGTNSWNGYIYVAQNSNVTVPNTITNGTVVASPNTDIPTGTSINLTITPEAGYELTALTLSNANGYTANVDLSQLQDGQGNAKVYTFGMWTEDVTVSATFTEIPHEHTWGDPVYNWAYDGTEKAWKCTATRTCSQDETHVDTETVTATKTGTTNPTCVDNGADHYTATFANTAFAAQTYDDVIPASGHTEVVDAAVPATCTTTGLTAGSHCSVCNTVITAQETVAKLAHTFENGRCTVCQAYEYPQVTVTELTENLDTVGGQTLDAEYVFNFANGQPTEDQLAAYSNANGWQCDYYVTFSGGNVTDNTIVLFGKYGSGAFAQGQPIAITGNVLTTVNTYHTLPLISLATQNGVTLSDLVNPTFGMSPFTCGVYHVPGSNAGVTMTVQLVMKNGDTVVPLGQAKSITFQAAPAPEVVIPDAGENNNATHLEANIQDGYFEAHKTDAEGVTVTGTAATVNFNTAAVAGLASVGALTLDVTVTDGENGAKLYTIVLNNNGTNVFTGGEGQKATVTVNYAVTGNNIPKVYLVDGQNLTPVTVTGWTENTVTFEVPHFSVYQVKQATSVATYVSGGTTYYTDSLAEAITNADSTVTLLQDVTGQNTINIPAGKSLTLDLAGHTVTAAESGAGRHVYAIENNGTLTLKDSVGGGKIETRGIDNYGTMTIESGEYVAIDTNGGAAVWNNPGATFNMTGGTLRVTRVGSSGDPNGVSCLYNEGTATITKGSFLSTCQRSYAIISSGDITINPVQDSDVVVSGAHGGLSIDSGTGTISGGQFTCTRHYGLYVSNDGTGTNPAQAQVTVSGGTFTGGSLTANAVLIGSDVNNPVNSTIEITGGTFNGNIHAGEEVVGTAATPAIEIKGGTINGTVTVDTSNPSNDNTIISVSGGTFTAAVPLNYCDEGCVPVANQGGTYGVEGGKIAYNSTTGVGYASLAAAVTTAQAGDTIVLVADDNVSLTNGQEIEINKSLTIDGAGYTIYGTPTNKGYNDIFISDATASDTITIKNVTLRQFGSQIATASGHAPLWVSTNNKASVVISNVTVQEFNRTGIFLGGGVCTVEDCYVDCNKSTSYGSVMTKGIEVHYAANATISDTTIVGANNTYSNWTTAGIEIYGIGIVTISNCSVTSLTNGIAISDVSAAQTGNDKGTATVTVSGSTITATDCALDNSTDNATLSVDSGSYTGELYCRDTNTTGMQVSGGTFSEQVPYEYCANGKIPTVADANGKYTVVAGTAVAAIESATSDTTYYADLPAAIAAASDGDTITLLADATGAGLFIGPNKFTSSGLTINFGGHTYTVETPVGSSGTVNQMLHFEQGNKITLTNGTIKVTADATLRAAFDMIMQNYCTLTIVDMVIDGTGIAVKTYSNSYSAPWGGSAKPQFNYNTAGSSVIRNSTITVTGDVSIDDAAGLTIEADAVITANKIVTKGTDERYASATPTVSVENGAKFTLADSTGAAAFDALLAAKGQSLGTPVNGVYTVETLKVAQIGDVKYESLAAAIAAVPTDGTATTITMIADETIVGNAGVTIPANKIITLDLNGHTLKNAVNENKASQVINNNGTLTIKSSQDGGTVTNSLNDGILSGYYPDRNYATNVILNKGTLTVQSGTIHCATLNLSYAIDNNSTNSNAELIIDGGSITSASSVAIRQFCNSTTYENNVNVEGGSISGAYSALQVMLPGTGQAKKASVSVSGGILTGNSYAFYDSTQGDVFTNVKYEITGGEFNGMVYARANKTEISNGTFTDSVYAYGNETIVSGGTFKDWLVFNESNPEDVTVSGGTFTGNGVYNFGSATGFISGGVFTEEPDPEHIVRGKAATVRDLDGKYIIDDAVAEIGTVGYISLEAALTYAEDGDTIKLLANSTGKGLFVGPNKFATDGLTIDFNGKTYTVETPVGSSGTVNQMLHFEQGNKITLTNGSIVVTADASKLAAFNMVMQNYCTLVIDDMIINGSGIAVAKYDSANYQQNYPTWYNTDKPQFNYNTAGSSIIRNSTITVTGDVSIDDAAGLTIEDDAVINANKIATKGTDERYDSATATISVENGAKFKLTDGAGAAAFDALLAANGQSLGTPVNGVYTVETLKVAQIVRGNETLKYATLTEAFAAAQNGETITLLADVALTDRLFVNAGANPAYAGSNNRYATTTDNKSLTLDLNGHNINSSSNIALAGGSLNITGTGSITTTNAGLAPIEVRGTGDLTSKRTLTIGANVVLNGAEYGLNVFGSNNNQKNVIDVTVNGTVNGMLFVLGNLKNANNEINIVVNGTVDASAVTGTEEKVHTGIAANGYANVTVNNNAVVKGESGIEVRAGSLTVNGGTITATANAYSYESNDNGTTIKGAAIAVAQHNTVLPVSATLNGGTLSGVTKIAVEDVNNNDLTNVTVLATQSYTANSEIPDDFKWVETATAGEYTLEKKDYVAQVNDGTKYETLAEAIAAAQDGDTITLLDNLELNAVVKLSENKTLTLNLGGHTLSSSVADDDAGTRVLTVEAGTLTVQNGTINGRVNAYDNGTLTIAANATVNGMAVVWGDGQGASAKTPTLNVYGTISNANGQAITTNGNDKSGATINIYDGAAVTATGHIAIYQPSGNVNVSGGTITGSTAIYQKSGTLTISGGELVGNGAANTPNFANGSGADATGDALVVESCAYPNGAPTVSISGGTFNSTNGKGIASYANESKGVTELAPVNATSNTITIPADEKWIADPNNAGKYLLVAKDYVAQVNDGTKYESLAEAIADVADGGTITLLADVNVGSDRIQVDSKSYTVALNGHTLSSSEADNIIFRVSNGKTITIDGSVAGSKMIGSAMIPGSNAEGHIVVNGGTYENDLYTPFYANGTCSSSSTIEISGATIVATDQNNDSDAETGFGLYVAGPAQVTLTNNEITAAKTGIEIRAGQTTLTDNTITALAASSNATANNNGGTVTGAAIAVSQHSTNLPITVTVNSGSYTGYYGLFEKDVQTPASGETVGIVIKDGTFVGNGTNGKAIEVYDVDNNAAAGAAAGVTAAISGGQFSSVVPAAYCAEDYIPVQTKNAAGYYTVEVGELEVPTAQYSATLTLKDNIDINFYVKNVSAADASRYTIKYRWADESDVTEVTLSDYTPVSDGRYKIKVGTIYSYQMWRKVHIEVYFNGNRVSINNLHDSIDYCASDYFHNMITKYENMGTQYASFVTLCKAALTYGAAAQTYFNGRRYVEEGAAHDYVTHADELVNYGINYTSNPTQPDATTYRASINGSVSTITRYNASLVLGTETAIKVFLTGPNDPNSIEITCVDDHNEAHRIEDKKLENDGRCSFKVSGIRSYELGRTFTITISNGTETATLTYSPFTYARNFWSTNEIGPLCQALVDYGTAAGNYWN